MVAAGKRGVFGTSCGDGKEEEITVPARAFDVSPGRGSQNKSVEGRQPQNRPDQAAENGLIGPLTTVRASMSSPTPALLSANELALSFGLQRVLDGVVLSVAPGEKVGLVGRNGCGKTCLLKILAGANQADAGEISRRRGLRVGYLPQEFELDGAKTVRENIEAGAARGWQTILQIKPQATIERVRAIGCLQ